MTQHILLIEPDAVLAQSYGRALKRAGYTVNWCQTAQAAIATADTAKPDVVVLELQLAGHNGVEFLYEFRSYPEWHDVPVVVLSMLPTDTALSHFARQQLGIVVHHYKPRTKLATLVESVNHLLASTAQ